MKKIGVIGSTGKVGSLLYPLIQNDPFWKWSCGVHRKTSDIATLIQQAEVLIDFSLPESLASYLPIALEHNIPLVIGTTGYSTLQKSLLEQASATLPIFYSPNFSIGIALVTEFLPKIATYFPYETITIQETHRIGKKDTPSATALSLQKAIGSPSSTIHSLRKEDTAGKHEILFSSSAEKLLLEHVVLHREVFAKGALQAARFLLEQKPGFYTMKDLLSTITENRLVNNPSLSS